VYENEFESDRAAVLGRRREDEAPADAAVAAYDAPAAVAGRVDAAGAGGLGRLQRTAGNTAVAAAVQRSAGSAALQRSAGSAALQRSAGAAALQRSESEEEPVQRSAVQETIAQPGRNLPGDVREPLERGFGRSLAHVQLHEDAAALSSAKDVGAYAYASGDHIVVPPGAPLETYAEEVEHTFQQRSGPVDGTPDGQGHLVSDPSDRFETAARERASEVVAASSSSSGAPAPTGAGPASGGSGAAVQRQEAEEVAEEEPVVQQQPAIQRVEAEEEPEDPEAA
jgi:hypothetical protein